MYNYLGYSHGYMMPGFDLVGSIVSILFWIIFIILIVSLFKRNHAGGCCGKHMDPTAEMSNLEIIKKRLAQGEIDMKEYEELKKELDAN